MALFAIMSGLSIYLSRHLHETFNIPPPDEIAELREFKESKENFSYRMSNDELKRESLMSQDTIVEPTLKKE